MRLFVLWTCNRRQQPWFKFFLFTLSEHVTNGNRDLCFSCLFYLKDTHKKEEDLNPLYSISYTIQTDIWTFIHKNFSSTILYPHSKNIQLEHCIQHEQYSDWTIFNDEDETCTQEFYDHEAYCLVSIFLNLGSLDFNIFHKKNCLQFGYCPKIWQLFGN